jgi:hypothetical protein
VVHFRIDINCDGWAFHDPREGSKSEPEIAAILIRYVQALVTTGEINQALYDGEGTRVGHAVLESG